MVVCVCQRLVSGVNLTMPARRDQLWKGIRWPGCALKNSASPYTRLVGDREEKCIFWGDQFQHQKMLPQRDFAVGGFSVAGVWKAATTGNST